jgi:hypothetical protein
VEKSQVSDAELQSGRTLQAKGQEHVLTVEDPRVVRSIAAEAAERAAWYGVPASYITPPLDRARTARRT